MPSFTPGQKVARRIARRWSSFICAATAMVRREAYDKTGGYAEDLGLASDMEMWVRLCSIGDVAYISEPLVKITIRSPSSLTSQVTWHDIQSLAKIQRINWTRAYTGNWPMLTLGKILCSIRRDIGYLTFLARAIIKTDTDLVQESIDIIKKECLTSTRGFAWLMRISITIYVLRAILPSYRLLKKLSFYTFKRSLY